LKEIGTEEYEKEKAKVENERRGERGSFEDSLMVGLIRAYQLGFNKGYEVHV
jgi:hypothetical protein